MITAADAAFGNDAVFERSTAMAAMTVQDSHITGLVAEGNQVLTENSGGVRQVCQFL